MRRPRHFGFDATVTDGQPYRATRTAVTSGGPNAGAFAVTVTGRV
jgi:hypothetical protein